MLTDHWPLLGLRLRTDRLELRLPSDEELAELGDVAAAGVHAPDDMPFLSAWTDVSPAQRARAVVQQHWRRRGTWAPDDWALTLVVFAEGRPVGVQAVAAQNFAVTREVHTGSWLGFAHQGRGIGREMRSAVLHLAFAGLGAQEATSAAFTDNPASLAVSARLGYRPDGVQRDSVQGRVRVSQRLRLSRADWEGSDRPEVGVTGLEPCLADFGLAPER
ncbi:RimJ/RimL family protein N-acetyltransferase [Streptomyces sp. TLI_235]|nr:GNAT family protein [Streptomyces sp. TLI_235]PBC76415.1 RimJ/RimL family protein N-acetyltransferase [Streptomyces sp. TLI_235]